MPEVHLDDTIVAIATPPGAGGIGIVRLSGPTAIQISAYMFRPNNGLVLGQAKSHTVHLGHVCDQNGQVIDQVLVTIFRAPKSYTAEDVVEISAHGGSHVLRKIVNLALSYGARHAEAGEFTRRAFLNGRIDLAQAEAVSDLICAKTDRSLELAVRQLTGKLSEEIKSIKDEIMRLYAHMEAYLDFPDEHLEIDSEGEFQTKFSRIVERLRNLIRTFSKGQILREGARAVIVGRPNVGKSSLLNALLERDRALVSEIPGTTRDVLEEWIELEGIGIRLADTAGLWASEDPLDRAAMERTKRCFEESDLFLLILDATEGYTAGDELILKELNGKELIPVVNKIDLPQQKSVEELKTRIGSRPICFLSAKTRKGIEILEQEMVRSILQNELGEESVLITRLRHKHALERSLAALRKSFEAFTKKESLEFVVLDLKESLDQLRELVGEIYSEDLLDVIFREFCIGK